MTDTSALAQRIQERAIDIGTRSIRLMYDRDPFWDDRFGTHGRHRSNEDGNFHVSYLVEALLGSERTIIQYARWLRAVLVARGMCSRHLADNFATLARVLRETPELGDVTPATTLLERATSALRHDGSAGAVQDAAEAIARQVVARVPALGPDGEWHISHLMSYVADSIALSRPGIAAGYARWLNDFAARTMNAHGYCAALLEEVRVSLGSAGLAPDVVRDAEQVLSAVAGGMDELAA